MDSFDSSKVIIYLYNHPKAIVGLLKLVKHSVNKGCSMKDCFCS